MPVTEEQKAEIDAMRDHKNATRRAVSRGAENRLFTAYPVLDHGFVRLVDYMGNLKMVSIIDQSTLHIRVSCSPNRASICVLKRLKIEGNLSFTNSSSRNLSTNLPLISFYQREQDSTSQEQLANSRLESLINLTN